MTLYGVRWEVDVTTPHRKYTFEWGGRKTSYTVSSTPSDRRSIEQALSSLRRVLGVKRKVTKNPKNRAKPYRKPSAPLPKMPKVTILPDPWEKLKERKVIIDDAKPAAALTSPVSVWQRVLRFFRLTNV